MRDCLSSFLLIAGRTIGIVRNDAVSIHPIVYSSSFMSAVTNHVPLQSRENKYLLHNGHCLRNGSINTLRTDYVIGCHLGVYRGTRGQTYCELSRDSAGCRTCGKRDEAKSTDKKRQTGRTGRGRTACSKER